MAKSASYRNVEIKKYGIHIVVLMIGLGIGLLIPSGQKSAPTTEPCTNSSSLAPVLMPESLYAPVFKEPGTIYSSKDGLILVRWSEVNGASKYHVRVWDEEGKEMKNFETARTFTFLKKLPVDPSRRETPYFVIVTPLDASAKRGQDSERKEIAMLPLRNLDPPTIKSIQTEQEEQPKPDTTPDANPAPQDGKP